MADILNKIPVNDEMTIFKTEVEPNKLNACIDNILMRLSRLETKFADVPSIVRCKDCKYAQNPNDTMIYCAYFECNTMSQNDFCSQGEHVGDING